MHMIRNTADTIAFAIYVSGHRGEVGMKRRTNDGVKDRCPVFGAENQVGEEV